MLALLEFVSIFGRLEVEFPICGLRSGTDYVAAQFVVELCGGKSINYVGRPQDIHDI